MQYKDVKELLLTEELKLQDVIDAYIDLRGYVGVGLISLGDNIQQYIYQHPTTRENLKVILCDNCKEDIDSHIDFHRCRAKDDSCISADCPDKVDRCDCECNDD